MARFGTYIQQLIAYLDITVNRKMRLPYSLSTEEAISFYYKCLGKLHSSISGANQIGYKPCSTWWSLLHGSNDSPIIDHIYRFGTFILK